MIQNPPKDWLKQLSSFIDKAIQSPELEQLIKRAQRDYLYWDKFKYLKMPSGISSEQAWSYLKLNRTSQRERTPVKAIDGGYFTFMITKSMYHDISTIDSNTSSGILGSQSHKLNASERNQLLVSSLTEEAIASSQIEGANTSRKVAKEMLLSQRKARTRSEQMIINNYQVMQRLMDWKDSDLSVDMLLDIQKTVTEGTLDDEKDSGRLRIDSDEIKVMNPVTGEVAFTPPSEEMMRSELQRLITYANTLEAHDEFIHSVVKACVLHFWLAYLHPFVDGNGRTARAIFYWFMLKRNYLAFQYLSVSRAIKKSKAQYDAVFVYTEKDDNDLSYFLAYNLRIVVRSINEFIQYYNDKTAKDTVLARIANKLGDFNERQIALLHYLNTHKDQRVDLKTHQAKYRIVYETARRDLFALVKKDLLDTIRVGNKFIFVPNTGAIKKLMSDAA